MTSSACIKRPAMPVPKDKGKSLLPHGEFRQAMLTFYAVTKGKRALDQIEEGRFSFSAWGVEFRQQLEVVQR